MYRKATTTDLASGDQGHFLGIVTELTYLEIMNRISKELYERKLVESEEVTSYSIEELKKYFGHMVERGAPLNYYGTNARGSSDRSLALGWKPKYTDKQQVLDGMALEVDRIVSSSKTA